jgi:hypothetical protein
VIRLQSLVAGRNGSTIIGTPTWIVLWNPDFSICLALSKPNRLTYRTYLLDRRYFHYERCPQSCCATILIKGL